MTTLKARKEHAAFLLAAGMTEAKAARIVGVDLSTLQSWQQKLSFRFRLEHYQVVVYGLINSHTAKSMTENDGKSLGMKG